METELEVLDSEPDAGGCLPVKAAGEPDTCLTCDARPCHGVESACILSDPSCGAPADLIGLIYEAAVDHSHWRTFLDAYVQVVGGRGCLVFDSGNRNGTLVRSSNWRDDDARRIIRHCTSNDVYRSAEPGDRGGYQLSGVFLRSPAACSTIVAIRDGREGAFAEPALEVLRSLVPHLRRAALLQNELSIHRVRLAGCTAYLDRHPSPLLLTDTSGAVIYANAAANKTAGLKDGLAITSGQLSLFYPNDHAAFLKSAARVAADGGPAFCRLEVKRPSRKSPYLLWLLAVPRPGLLPDGAAQSFVTVLIVDNEARPELDSAMLRELFSLTLTESRVVGKLGGGSSAEEISENMGVSLETVRTHIRRILCKTATARQGQVIALVLRVAPFLDISTNIPY